MASQSRQSAGTTRRGFLRASAVGAAALGGLSIARGAHAAGSEVANVGTISTTLPDGGGTVHTDLVATYRIGDDGRVVALRAYWSLDEMRFD